MRMQRFAIIGVLVALSYLLLYLAFLALDLPRVIANALAFGLAICLQYVGQTCFTFGRRLQDLAQLIRFGVMVSCGFVTSAGVTGWLGPLFAVPDWAVAAVVTVILPVQNYLLMRLWVYAPPQGHERLS
ncbi:hypothetical protein So717_27710 [Roseobacter cerasinus]|uniref:GtrA/DPMS transmembrane domain-containing protein n=1 Tax=Roseobacter cerasinus TaxID=2602289 RepID=A0A640VRJ9_9RHOB|nr:GtrA family protein [Roseobacter cerasinus]GFE51018.1 hypothetical protein So717_27710 [Roseobacter cerasinus]